ncbi:MAG: NAD(P)H-dependent oxidoreductase [Bacteroidales bacterium]|nr:NAD(P)H-dependent oxidoreductase [Bacteroidales bacterium]
MKHIKLMTIVAATAMLAVSCGQKKEAPKDESPKYLVLYYSQTSNTKAVAEQIANLLNADIEEIVATQPYDGDFQATIERCIQERELGVKPEIQPLTADISQYDVIFIGYPVWFGTYAPPVAAWLNQADLSGKKVVPFCTFGSGGLESSAKDLAAKQPNAEVLPGYGVRAARLEAMPKEVEEFLKAGGFIEGEYTPLPDFGDMHDVSADEAAIFDTAVDGYPMLNAEAKSVAVRTIPNGTEYLFVAMDKPREAKADMPPAGELQVYVTVLEGETPVFTKVIR